MYEQFIKECLLSNQFRVYAIIAQTYFEKLDTLKPLLFKKWLAKKLCIDEEKINTSSLGSALARHRQKMKRQTNNTGAATSNLQTSTQKPPFRFSKDEGLSQQENIVEL